MWEMSRNGRQLHGLLGKARGLVGKVRGVELHKVNNGDVELAKLTKRVRVELDI